MNNDEFLDALQNGDMEKLENDQTTNVPNSKGDVSLYYDHSKEHAEEIFPLMEKLSALCKKYGIPHMLWVIPSHDKEGTGNSMICDATHPVAKKMSVLAKMADNTVGIQKVLQACLLIWMMTKKDGGEEADKK